MLRYFDGLGADEGDSLMARQILNDLPVTSPFWSFEAWSNVGASNLIFKIARVAKDDARVDAYIDRVIAENEDPDVRSHFLYRAIDMADYTGDDERKWRYYTKLINEHGDGYHAKQLRRKYDQQRVIQKGNQMPAFTFTSIDDSSQVHTSDKLAGKSYIMDFWGTWCGPCIEEIPHLEEAYTTYGDGQLEIISVAMMDEKSSVQQFREDRYAMPWLHTLVSLADDNAVREKFELTGFPRPILVDGNGKIVATDKSLRGDSLTLTLEKHFGPG